MEALEKVNVVFKRAIKSGWIESLAISELIDGSGFLIIKKCGTGIISVTCNGAYFYIDRDEYFVKGLKEEREKSEYGHYGFLEDEAKELLRQFKNTYEGKASLMYENISDLLEKGRKVFVLNETRKRECTESKKDYLVRKIQESLKLEHKTGYWVVT